MVKKIATFAAGAGLVLATVAPAFAQNVCDNFTTGPNSWNTCTRLLKKKVKLELRNKGNVIQTVNFTANSGNNSSDNNTVGGSVITDDADVGQFESKVDLNSVLGTVGQIDPATEDWGSNDLTGPSSNNTVNMTTRKTVNATVNNVGDVIHTANATANTGNNTSNMNTMGGLVSTGKATVDALLETVLNSVFILITQ